MGAEAGRGLRRARHPADLDEAGCLELYDGLAEVAAETGTALAGGDVSAAPVLTLAVTVVGHVAPAGARRRAQGRVPGHVARRHGRARRSGGGAAALRAPRAARRRSTETAAAALVAALRRPATPARRGRARSPRRRRGDDRRQRRARRRRGPSRARQRAWLTIELGRVPIAAGRRRGRGGGRASTRSTSRPRAARTTSCWSRCRPSGSSDAGAAVRETGTGLTAIGEVSDGCGVELRATDGSARPASRLRTSRYWLITRRRRFDLDDLARHRARDQLGVHDVGARRDALAQLLDI